MAHSCGTLVERSILLSGTRQTSSPSELYFTINHEHKRIRASHYRRPSITVHATILVLSHNTRPHKLDRDYGRTNGQTCRQSRRRCRREARAADAAEVGRRAGRGRRVRGLSRRRCVCCYQACHPFSVSFPSVNLGCIPSASHS